MQIPCAESTQLLLAPDTLAPLIRLRGKTSFLLSRRSRESFLE